jgi:NAD(P)-dependent dehydrogenase (short-subunit alcohol dehydrogenase family)
MAKTVLITGAGGGIGRVTARAFLAAGWQVGRREAALAEIARGEAAALILPGDVGRPEDVDRVFARVEARWGRLDVLFNIAGIFARTAPIGEISVEDWLAVCQTNITGMVLSARAGFGLMRRQDPRGGRIINNGSISAQVPRPGSVPYTVSKHAVTGLTKSLALDGRRFDITASQIDIGNALTEMTAGFPAGVPQPDGSVRPEPVIDAVHVADMVLHLAGLPLDVAVPFVTVMARDMPLMGRG